MFVLRSGPAIILLMIALLLLEGCVYQKPIPDTILMVPPHYLSKRQYETRFFETMEEEKVVSAVVGVLQDLGFTIGDTESNVGLVSGSKDRTAKDSGQFVMATLLTAVSAAASSYSYGYEDYYGRIDDKQNIRASVTTIPDSGQNRVYVRVNFQRVIWNRRGNISRLETIADPILYSGFFDRLSKSIFLQQHPI